MKKIGLVGLGLLVFVFICIGVYFLFPETLFDLAVKAGRHSAGLVRKEIQVDAHRIVYLDGGKGETILLLHGFAAGKDNWIRFAKHLTKGYRVVIPDIPGFGESSRIGSERYDMENQIKRIDRLTEELKLDKFHLAGNSMGGTLAALYAARYPVKVETLALMAPGGVGSPNPSELAVLLQKGTNPLLTGSEEDFDRLIRLCFANPPFIPSQFKKVIAAQAEAQREFNQKIWDDMVGSRMHESSFSMENFLQPYLPRIQAPVLILWGNSDRILDVGGAAVLAKGLKISSTVIMKETGHTPMMEKPLEAATHYLHHLKRKI